MRRYYLAKHVAVTPCENQMNEQAQVYDIYQQLVKEKGIQFEKVFVFEIDNEARYELSEIISIK